MPVDEQGREYDESWDTISGLVDDIDAAVLSSRFDYLEEYRDSQGNPQCLMILTLQQVRQDGAGNWVPEGEPFDQAWSTGKGWEPVDGGKAAVHASGRRRFINSSMYGLLLNRVKGLWPDVKFRGAADQAGILDGTVWHWQREKIEYGGRLEEREHLMPVKYLGQMQKKTAAAKTAAAKTAVPASATATAATTTAAAATSTAAAVNAGEAGDWEADLTALALSNESHADFVKAFLADKSLTAQVKAAGKLRDVLDPKDTGFWAKARAEAGL